MAKRLTPTSEEAGADGTKYAVNSTARKEMIANTCREMHALDGKITALQEERRTLINTNIKGHLGLKVADFNAAYRLYKLEGDRRDTYFDTLRECFEALGVGQQLDFLAADAKAAAKPKKNGKGAETSDEEAGYTFAEGEKAGAGGKSRDTNPHAEGTPQHAKWDKGWLKAQTNIARDMGANGATAH